MSWSKENPEDKAVKLILFLISPFFSALYSVKTINTKSSYIVFFLFAVFFGLAFSVPSGKNEVFGGDGASYRQKFDSYIEYGSDLYYHRLYEYITFTDGNKDFYFDTIAYFTTTLTHNYHVMFMVFAVVFSIFALKSFRFFTSVQIPDKSYVYFMLVFLFMINHIFNINGVRFWTAAWVAVYGLLTLFTNNKKIGWVFILITPFFHGSYWLFIAVVLIAYFLKRFEKTWIFLFFISFIFSSFATEIIARNSQILPPFLMRMADLYTSSDAISNRQTRTEFQKIDFIFKILIRIIINLMVYLFIKNSSIIRLNSQTKSLYLFLLVWMTFVNFSSTVPSLGDRFLLLSYPLIAYIWLVNFGTKKYKRIFDFIPIVFALTFLTIYVLYTSVLDWTFFISSPFVLIYKYLIAT